MSVNLDLPPIVEIEDSLEAVIDFFETQGWTDGLPFIPPTRARVEEMYRYIDRKSDNVIATLAPRNGEATVERIAVNAVMAGCWPEYLPVLITAVQAIADEAFNLNGIQSTTHPCGVLMLLNGPVARELNVNSGYNCFGQGWRANATIGRAMRLMLLNIGGGTPGDGDRSTHGSPAKFSYCAAENETDNPWEPLHVEKGFNLEDSTVTVMACEAPHNVNDHVSVTGHGLLTTIARAMRQPGSNNMSSNGGQPLVVLGPEHAEAIAKDGITKDEAKQELWKQSQLAMEDASADWIKSRTEATAEGEGGESFFQMAEHWSRINLIIAGGAGKHSCWIPTFGRSGMTDTVTRRIERADGSPVHSVYDLGTT
tara:strand:- start:50 stop:1153 length:1104 start_codon:yes stop_codon:yes gene_type:complete